MSELFISNRETFEDALNKLKTGIESNTYLNTNYTETETNLKKAESSVSLVVTLIASSDGDRIGYNESEAEGRVATKSSSE